MQRGGPSPPAPAPLVPAGRRRGAAGPSADEPAGLSERLGGVVRTEAHAVQPTSSGRSLAVEEPPGEEHSACSESAGPAPADRWVRCASGLCVKPCFVVFLKERKAAQLVQLS